MSVPNTVMTQSQTLFQGKWPRNSRHVFNVPCTVKSQKDEQLRSEMEKGLHMCLSGRKKWWFVLKGYSFIPLA